MDFPPEPPDRPLRDAATVIVLREGDDGFEVFMVRRHRKSGFMGGAYVFPGGKVDALDADPALTERMTGRSAREAAEALGEAGSAEAALALYAAAVRETFEECGLLVAEGPEPRAVEEGRRLLGAGVPFPEVVARLDARLCIDRLVPYARWVTPVVETHRFDTRFFVAIAPAGQVARHDGSETTEGAWLRPDVALGRERAKEIFMAPPTVRTLECLARFDSPAEVMRDAASRRPPLVRPVFTLLDGAPALTLPGDPAHPEPDRVLEGATRLVLIDGRWQDGDAHPRT